VTHAIRAGATWRGRRHRCEPFDRTLCLEPLHGAEEVHSADLVESAAEPRESTLDVVPGVRLRQGARVLGQRLIVAATGVAESLAEILLRDPCHRCRGADDRIGSVRQQFGAQPLEVLRRLRLVRKDVHGAA